MRGAKTSPIEPWFRLSLLWIVLVMGSGVAMAQTESDAMAGQIDGFYQKNCNTAGCHPIEQGRGTLHHPPYLELSCLTCHDSHVDETHAPLKPQQDQLCASCHTKTEVDALNHVVHPAGTDKSCLECHDPHASPVRNLLRNEQQLASCLDCHQETLDRAENAPYKHHYFNPQRECGNCHYTHENREAHFLRPNVRETCLTCHYLPIQGERRQLKNIAMEIRTKPTVHAVVMNQGCPTCHTPHGSTQPSLMRAGYPSGNYAGYQRENFMLCFQCHDPELAEASETRTATNFRDGARNLHQTHIVGLKKGRSCHLCHEAHASDRPFLLRNTIRFNEWRSDFDWVQQGEGASCTTACHKVQSYDPGPRVAGPKMVSATP